MNEIHINGTDIYYRIVKLLELENIKKSDFYKSIGITRQHISKWKAGSIPSCDTLYKIKLYLNVSFDYLLTGKDIQNNLPEIKTKSKIKKQINELLKLL